MHLFFTTILQLIAYLQEQLLLIREHPSHGEVLHRYLAGYRAIPALTLQLPETQAATCLPQQLVKADLIIILMPKSQLMPMILQLGPGQLC